MRSAKGGSVKVWGELGSGIRSNADAHEQLVSPDERVDLLWKIPRRTTTGIRRLPKLCEKSTLHDFFKNVPLRGRKCLVVGISKWLLIDIPICGLWTIFFLSCVILHTSNLQRECRVPLKGPSRAHGQVQARSVPWRRPKPNQPLEERTIQN